ncbi:Predicted coiled-coil protein [Plasmopara halstedii]|uniref:Coiled-coil domain-containing protein 86 n=1 Tax=Plasmopara halstedii TaxID=4781 RepID=A0A0P1AE35_PLAHL|nr:Predicted coiled-coil protein [Plasmopara halstedii]CEG38820.1 Predicted coiled-coil protein [Plasmopara halstedii]|eukprot:XP_024575189.1 Predicted coiled-coil protein [Plasmopara halstedii]
MTTTRSSKPGSVNVKASEPPRGRPVSGRVWKKVQKTRFSTQSLKGSKVLSTTWEEKMLQRSKLKNLKELQTEIKMRRQAEKDAKRQAREEKEKRRKENELKSAAVQVISRTHRLKTMSKKQLRNIKKTIVNKHGVVEYVPVYSK